MKTTIKDVQVHTQCVCGRNEVYTAHWPIKWKDLTKAGIKKRFVNGNRWLSINFKFAICTCYEG